MVVRVPSGIYGLDELIEGGFPEKRNILISGACGTGKSIFCVQYLYKGAVDYGEPGIFVTFDEPPYKIREDMVKFGWDLKALEKSGDLKIVDASVTRMGMVSEEKTSLTPGIFDFDQIALEIMKIIRESRAKRIAIDSLPAMALHLKDSADIRRAMFKLSLLLSKAEVTALLTSEIPEQSLSTGQAMSFSKYGVEEYIVDGVLLLNYLGVGSQATRTMYIRKMRATEHSSDIHPMEITNKGIVIKKVEEY